MSDRNDEAQENDEGAAAAENADKPRGGRRGQQNASKVSKADLIAALSDMSPAERRALIGGADARETRPQTPKMSAAIDAIPEGERADVVKALTRVSKAQDASKQQAEALADIQQRWPDLANAITVNTHYRQKPPSHSVRVAIDALNRKQSA